MFSDTTGAANQPRPTASQQSVLPAAEAAEATPTEDNSEFSRPIRNWGYVAERLPGDESDGQRAAWGIGRIIPDRGRVGEVDVRVHRSRGPCAQRDIAKAMQTRRVAFRGCYARVELANPGLQGTLALAWKQALVPDAWTGGQYHDGSSTVLQDGLQDDAVVECVQRAVSRVRVSRSDRGKRQDSCTATLWFRFWLRKR